MKNSGASPTSKLELAAVAGALAVLVAAFARWALSRGYILYWGDAQAHLNISRSILDAQDNGYEQWGTVWLPVLHFICLPFAQNDWLWRTGLAGTIPVAACFVLAGTCFYLAAKQVFGTTACAVTVVAAFALNPNMLYLSSIPMTETVFLAGLAVAFLSILRFRENGGLGYWALALTASWWMSLTRYDGWFLIPFIGFLLARAARRQRAMVFLAFCALAGLAPICWAAWNWWETGSALDFINGPYSPRAIQGDKPYIGLHNWRQAFQYYFTAGALCSGPALASLGALGTLLIARRRRLWICFFVLLTPLFYVWSMHSSGATPIHVPVYWPFSYYNTRYGVAVNVMAAFGVGALVSIVPPRWKTAGALVAVLLTGGYWLVDRNVDHWICWKESEQNSIARRAWTESAAEFLRKNYEAGDGVMASFGDVTGIFAQAGIPLRETIHEGSHAGWFAAITAPQAYHPAKWAVALDGDRVSIAMKKNPDVYAPVLDIREKDARTLEIYRRIK